MTDRLHRARLMAVTVFWERRCRRSIKKVNVNEEKEIVETAEKGHLPGESDLSDDFAGHCVVSVVSVLADDVAVHFLF